MWLKNYKIVLNRERFVWFPVWFPVETGTSTHFCRSHHHGNPTDGKNIHNKRHPSHLHWKGLAQAAPGLNVTLLGSWRPRIICIIWISHRFLDPPYLVQCYPYLIKNNSANIIKDRHPWTLKHCQRHNGPKALSTLTHSTTLVQSRSFNKLWNLGQLHFGFVWQLRQIHVKTLTKPCSNFAKSM